MEYLNFEFPAALAVRRRAHVGVVGSGDMEILLLPAQPGEKAAVSIVTRFGGNRAVWETLLGRFFAAHPIAAALTIHDFGATPGLASLRLEQVLEECLDDTAEE